MVIDAYEGRGVATVDVGYAYLNAIMDEFVAMNIEDDMVNYMVQADSEKYSKHVCV